MTHTFIQHLFTRKHFLTFTLHWMHPGQLGYCPMAVALTQHQNACYWVYWTNTSAQYFHPASQQAHLIKRFAGTCPIHSAHRIPCQHHSSRHYRARTEVPGPCLRAVLVAQNRTKILKGAFKFVANNDDV